jgi:hypothetical protein
VPHKLNYEITGRQLVEGSLFPTECVSVEWRHASGPVVDYADIPVTHPPNVRYERREVGRREVVHDNLYVPPGTNQSIVMQMLEEKRGRLAAALGVEP